MMKHALAVAVVVALASPTVGAEDDWTKRNGRKLTMQFKQAALRNVLTTVGEVGNVNVIVDDDITAKIDADFKEVEWNKALLRIATDNALTITHEHNAFIVTKPQAPEATTARAARRNAVKWSGKRMSLRTSGARVDDVMRLLVAKGAPVSGALPPELASRTVDVVVKNVPVDGTAALVLDSLHAPFTVDAAGRINIGPAGGVALVDESPAAAESDCAKRTAAPAAAPAALKPVAVLSGDSSPLALVSDGARVDIVAKGACVSSDKRKITRITNSGGVGVDDGTNLELR